MSVSSPGDPNTVVSQVTLGTQQRRRMQTSDHYMPHKDEASLKAIRCSQSHGGKQTRGHDRSSQKVSNNRNYRPVHNSHQTLSHTLGTHILIWTSWGFWDREGMYAAFCRWVKERALESLSIWRSESNMLWGPDAVALSSGPGILGEALTPHGTLLSAVGKWSLYCGMLWFFWNFNSHNNCVYLRNLAWFFSECI